MNLQHSKQSASLFISKERKMMYLKKIIHLAFCMRRKKKKKSASALINKSLREKVNAYPFFSKEIVWAEFFIKR